MSVSPTWQVPFELAEQQPVLHAAVASHELVHWLLTQARRLEQSVKAEVHPQAKLTHCVPFTLPEHETQTPELPHAPGVVPDTQLPPVAEEQQPPRQVWPEEHDVVHVCVEVLHE